MSEIEKKEIDESVAEENGVNETDPNAKIANGDEKTVNAKKSKKKKPKKPSSE